MQIYDAIVVGSGLAGLSFALKAAKKGKVLIITKSFQNSGSTGRAQGGIASVMHPMDSIEKHIQDTLLAGAGACREDQVRRLISKGPQAIENLVNWGVRFSQDPSGMNGGSYHLVREGGHSDSRILHSEDITGREIQRALVAAVQKSDQIEVKDKYMGVDLVCGPKSEDPSRPYCYGLYALNMQSKQVDLFLGKVTVLCTGGVGQVYVHSTNDTVSTGDGIAMAYRAGALIEDMEFMQFHPTSFFDPGQPTFLISEILRGHGGRLINHEGKRIMEGVHPALDLAPRDIVARSIDAEMKRSGKSCVYLDMTEFPEEELKAAFPNIYLHCYERGINMSTQPIPVVPAAHFSCGGIKVDSSSRSTLEGLYACGETACTGVHGANRLASNSLLEAAVFSELAWEHIESLPEVGIHPAHFKPWDASKVKPVSEYSVYTSALENLKSIMWNYVGIVRNDVRLNRAKEFVDLIVHQVHRDYGSFTLDPLLLEIRNLAQVASLIIEGALLRKESRGLHYNLDYPEILPQAVHYGLSRYASPLISA